MKTTVEHYAKLIAERDALKADAERYRWLRSYAHRQDDFPIMYESPQTAEQMDALIDAAMKDKP